MYVVNGHRHITISEHYDITRKASGMMFTFYVLVFFFSLFIRVQCTRLPFELRMENEKEEGEEEEENYDIKKYLK